MEQRYAAGKSGIICSKANFQKIKEKLEKDNCGLIAEYELGLLFIKGTREDLDEENLSQESVNAIADALKERELEYLEIGSAYFDKRMKEASCGGYSFRITKDGNLDYPKVDWDHASGLEEPLTKEEALKRLKKNRLKVRVNVSLSELMADVDKVNETLCTKVLGEHEYLLEDIRYKPISVWEDSVVIEFDAQITARNLKNE